MAPSFYAACRNGQCQCRHDADLPRRIRVHQVPRYVPERPACAEPARDLGMVSVACTLILATRRMPDDAFDALTGGPVDVEQTWSSRRRVADWLEVAS